MWTAELSGHLLLDLERPMRSRRFPAPRSCGSPRWSPDGRHIVVFPRNADQLMLFGADTQKWTELAKMRVDWPDWSGTTFTLLGFRREASREYSTCGSGTSWRNARRRTSLPGIAWYWKYPVVSKNSILLKAE
jgi:hypothetical protein